MWLGLQYDRGSGLVWVDGSRVVAYPASSRLFVWESRRLLSQETSYADSSRHYGFYIDGDIAKLPGGGRKGAAVLCELIPGQLAPEPGREAPGGEGVGGRGGGYPQGGGGGRGRRPPNYPSDGDGGYPDTPYYRRGGQ